MLLNFGCTPDYPQPVLGLLRLSALRILFIVYALERVGESHQCAIDVLPLRPLQSGLFCGARSLLRRRALLRVDDGFVITVERGVEDI